MDTSGKVLISFLESCYILGYSTQHVIPHLNIDAQRKAIVGNGIVPLFLFNVDKVNFQNVRDMILHDPGAEQCQ